MVKYFELGSKLFEIQKDVNAYGLTFYRIINPGNYYDSFSFIKCNVFYEYYNENENRFTYTFGFFKDNDFIECFVINDYKDHIITEYTDVNEIPVRRN